MIEARISMILIVNRMNESKSDRIFLCDLGYGSYHLVLKLTAVEILRLKSCVEQMKDQHELSFRQRTWALPIWNDFLKKEKKKKNPTDRCEPSFSFPLKN